MAYKVIVNGRTDTASRTFAQVVDALVEAYERKDTIRVRVFTRGQQERDLNAEETQELSSEAASRIQRSSPS